MNELIRSLLPTLQTTAHVFIYFHFPKEINPPNKRSFRGPGGDAGGLDSVSLAKTCARELLSGASSCLQGAFRGLPLTTGWTIYLDQEL